MKRTLDNINERILVAVKNRPKHIKVPEGFTPRLVAVSKFKPISAIIEAYQHGQRFFGENYIQEIEEKSNSTEIVANCPDIRFHFIGHLQSSKVSKLMNVKNLHMLETVDSIKLANLLEKNLEKRSHESSQEPKSIARKMNVMIQVNTSQEEQKHGIKLENTCELAEHLVSNCKHLRLVGLMTIGAIEHRGNGPNQDFLKLYQLRETVANKLGLNVTDLELSMGMSGDFEEAIMAGSTNVRVGSLIFGERVKQSE